jgi:hypothetical protein
MFVADFEDITENRRALKKPTKIEPELEPGEKPTFRARDDYSTSDDGGDERTATEDEMAIDTSNAQYRIRQLLKTTMGNGKGAAAKEGMQRAGEEGWGWENEYNDKQFQSELLAQQVALTIIFELLLCV